MPTLAELDNYETGRRDRLTGGTIPALWKRKDSEYRRGFDAAGPPTFIDRADLQDRGVYLLRSRNLRIGVWCPEQDGFIGIRTKLGSRFLDVEYEASTPGPVRTARAVEMLDEQLPDDMVLNMPAHRNDALFAFLDAIDT